MRDVFVLRGRWRRHSDLEWVILVEYVYNLDHRPRILRLCFILCSNRLGRRGLYLERIILVVRERG